MILGSFRLWDLRRAGVTGSISGSFRHRDLDRRGRRRAILGSFRHWEAHRARSTAMRVTVFADYGFKGLVERCISGTG